MVPHISAVVRADNLVHVMPQAVFVDQATDPGLSSDAVQAEIGYW
jgi:hypothetical protein